MRKGIKRLLGWTIGLLIGLPLTLLLLAGLAYAGYAAWARGSADDAHVAYLRTHSESVATPAALRFSVFDSAYYRNRFFLLGESHGCAVPQELDFALLRHLHERAGVRHYAAEIDPAQAFCFNEYLRTGDEARLRAVFDGWAGTAQWGNQDFLRKIQRIRGLNETLPAERRIRFIGLDRVQDVVFFGRYLDELLTSANYGGGAAALDSLRAALKKADAKGSAVAPLARRAATQMPTLPDSVTAPLLTALRNLGYLGKPAVPRDSVMLLNLGAEYAAGRLQPADKLYGLWGFAHVLQDEFNHQRGLAGMVRRSPLPCRAGVVSVPIFLLDSEMMVPKMGMPAPMRPKDAAPTMTAPMSQDGPVVFTAGIKDLVAVSAPQTVTLVRLDAPNSPYRHSQRLAAVRAPLFNQTLVPTRPGAVTTDFFQYALLVRNSPAVTPYAPSPTGR